MTTHDSDSGYLMGYLLPEDSQFRLVKLGHHLRLLEKLAEPRTADEGQGDAPQVCMEELAFCMEFLAEQVDRVLDEVSQPVRRTRTQGQDNSPAEVSVEVAEAVADQAVQTGEDKFFFGVTLDQIDKLNLLIKGIKAYGDAVYAEVMADFACGTLSMLGYTIFDRASEVDEILKEIEVQQI